MDAGRAARPSGKLVIMRDGSDAFTISAFAEAHDERRAVEAGWRFVRKPVTFARFERRWRRS
jgi:hypothetical protein